MNALQEIEAALAARKKTVADQAFGDNKAPVSEILAADFAFLEDVVKRAEDFAAKQNLKPASDEEQAALGKAIIGIRNLAKRIDGIRADEKAPVFNAGKDIDAFFKGFDGRLTTALTPVTRAADDYVRRKAAEERARAEKEAQEARERAERERQKAEAAKTAAAAGNAEGRAEALDAKADALEQQASASAADLTRARIGGVTSTAREVWTFRIDDYAAAVAPLGSLGPYLKREAVESALTSMVRIQKDAARWPGVTFFQDVKSDFRR